MFIKKKHNTNLYNKLLILSRNIFFYKDLSFKDTFETRVYLMFFHYSIILIILKMKKNQIDQDNYNNLFFCIENNLRELGLGDVSVNKKMKNLNNIFYDILLKLNLKNDDFKLNKDVFISYFDILAKNEHKLEKCKVYFEKFYEFCFELPPKHMIESIENFNY